jgi:hypothetical protein
MPACGFLFSEYPANHADHALVIHILAGRQIGVVLFCRVTGQESTHQIEHQSR